MEQCIFGNHLKPSDIYIEKDPEGVKFCMDCAEKIKDEKTTGRFINYFEPNGNKFKKIHAGIR